VSKLTETAIDLRDVGVSFQSVRGEVHAFSGVSFKAAAGRFVVLIGPSGCGKSTLLRVIADLLPPSTGELAVCDDNPAQVRRERRTSFVFQDATLLPWRTVTQNVRLPLEVGRWKRLGRQSNTPEEMISLVGLAGREKAYPHELSGGQRQRVSIARALVTKPDVLLMDEPFGALDEITRDHLNDVLLRIWRELKTTIVFVTHSLAEAAFLGQTVAVMAANPGRFADVVDLDGRKANNEIDRSSKAFFDITSQLRNILSHASGGH